MFTLFSSLLQILPRAILMFGLHLNIMGNPMSWQQYKKRVALLFELHRRIVLTRKSGENDGPHL